jgi:hypothetical protein
MKQKLFTTEDFVDIYPGDKYFCVTTKDIQIQQSILDRFAAAFQEIVLKKRPNKIIPAFSIAGPHKDYKRIEESNPKYFSTHLAAAEFVSDSIKLSLANKMCEDFVPFPATLNAYLHKEK